MPSLITSYDSATQNSGTVLNQIQFTYTGFGQLSQEYQEPGGAVTIGSSLSVLYGYLGSAGTANRIWPSTVTYPNSRSLSYSYGSTGR